MFIQRVFSAFILTAMMGLLAPVATNAAAPSGLALTATPVAGHNAVDITVTGPSQVPVVITLTATIDPDLPTVTISRKQFFLGADGKLQERITLAPNYWDGSRVTITASSIDGVLPAAVVVKVLRANPSVPEKQ